MNWPPESASEEYEHKRQVAPPESQIAELYRDFADPMQRLAWAILRDWGLAADAVQEAFAIFAQRIAEIPAEQRAGWLLKAVQYQAHNLRRKENRAAKLVQDYGQSGLVREPVEAYAIDRRESLEQLARAIEQLPAQQQAVVQLRMSEGKSFAEIAEQLNTPLGTVLSRMRLALEKLRTKFKS